MEDLLVDYSNIEQKGIGEKKVDPKLLYLGKYDDTTCLYYRSHRTRMTDPLTYDELQPQSCFKFPYMWNSNTGERLAEDPFGPLCFHPMNLLECFYTSRLNKLWVDPVIERDGSMYEGYYADGVGAGDDLQVTSNKSYPECYLFRLPVPNCYMEKNQKLSLITMGPKLTNKEICEIDRLIVRYWSNHRLYNKIYTKIGSLFKLKCYYDVAIAKNPIDMDLTGIDMGDRKTALEHVNPNMYLNILAIEKLKSMK